MGEVGDEVPSSAVATTIANSCSEKEGPTSDGGHELAKQLDARPNAPDEGAMFQAAWEPFAPEVFVAFTTRASFWHVHEPPQCERHTCVVEANEVSERDADRSSDEGELVFHQPVQGHLSSQPHSPCQQINGARVVLHVLEDEHYNIITL